MKGAAMVGKPSLQRRKSAAFSLSLRERVGVREATQRNRQPIKNGPGQGRLVFAVSLTPTLSRREREKVGVYWQPPSDAAWRRLLAVPA